MGRNCEAAPGGGGGRDESDSLEDDGDGGLGDDGDGDGGEGGHEIFPRFAAEGAASLRGCVAQLAGFYHHCSDLLRDGWELAEPVDTGRGVLARRPAEGSAAAPRLPPAAFEFDDGRAEDLESDDSGGEGEEGEDAPRRCTLRIKYMFEGAATLESLCDHLRAVAADFAAHERVGWRLAEPVRDGWMHLVQDRAA